MALGTGALSEPENGTCLIMEATPIPSPAPCPSPSLGEESAVVRALPNAAAMASLGLALRRAGRLDEGIAALRQAAEISPREPNYRNLANEEKAPATVFIRYCESW